MFRIKIRTVLMILTRIGCVGRRFPSSPECQPASLQNNASPSQEKDPCQKSPPVNSSSRNRIDLIKRRGPQTNVAIRQEPPLLRRGSSLAIALR